MLTTGGRMENAVGEACGGTIVLEGQMTEKGRSHIVQHQRCNGLIDVEGNGFDAGLGALRIGRLTGLFDLFGEMAFTVTFNKRFVPVLAKIGGNESLIQLVFQAHNGQRHRFYQQQRQRIKHSDISEKALHPGNKNTSYTLKLNDPGHFSEFRRPGSFQNTR